MAKQTVTVYTVRFTGLFGRNRGSKSHFSTEQHIGPESPNEDFLASLVNAEAAKIKPKFGLFQVIRYANCESDSYFCNVQKKEVQSLVIPITEGRNVYQRDILRGETHKNLVIA